MSLIEKALGCLYWLLLNLARISPAGSSWGLIFSTYVYVTIHFLFQQIRNSGSSTLFPFLKLNWLDKYSTFGWCFNSYMLLHTSFQQPSGKWQLRNYYYAHFTDETTRGPVTCLRSCTIRKWWSLGLKTLDSKSKPSHLGLPLRCLHVILR